MAGAMNFFDAKFTPPLPFYGDRLRIASKI